MLNVFKDKLIFTLKVYLIGHGRLLMKDGSFYEGKFENGEISGPGIRKWAATGSIYEGEFLKGELNGNGVMKYGTGTVYEGQWYENMKQGKFVHFLTFPGIRTFTNL